MRLSKRLETIIGMVSVWASQKEKEITAADVGTDHGFVPIALVERGIVKRALAMDVGRGPLLRAREHVRERGLKDRIELRLSDGLSLLSPGEADVVILSGMGGELMLRILREGVHVRDSVKCWILSPQSELFLFRRGLGELGLAIQDEVMVKEDGKYYVVMAAEKGHMGENDCLRYGEALIRKKDPILREFLEQEREQLLKIREKLLDSRGEAAMKRLEDVERRLGEAEDVQKRLNTKQEIL